MRSIESRAPRTLSPGRRIELLRRQRGLSRRGLADIVGRSEEWMRLVESGRQRLDSVELILRLANALHVEDFRELVSVPHDRDTRPAAADRSLPHSLEHVLFEPPAALAANNRWPTEMSDDAFAAAVAGCRETWTSCPTRYSRLNRRLPAAVAVARHKQSSLQPPRSGRDTIDIYHVARLFLSRVGAHHLALTVADRATELAMKLGHPRLLSVSAWHMASALLQKGDHESAARYALSAARRIRRAAGNSAESIYLWGAFQLIAALATARNGNGRTAQNCLSGAVDATARCSSATVPGVEFGAVEIGLARMEIALASHDHSDVLRAATTIDPAASPAPLTTVARYHIVVARAYAARGEYVAATLALQRAADGCPEELRYDEDAHRSLQQLIRARHGRPNSTVLRLAATAHLI